MKRTEILSSEQRAESYAARRFLRSLLSAELGCPISAVKIIQTPHNKPRLVSGQIEFSLSHRNRWCAVALSRACPVGVDVEPIRPFMGMEEVVAEFFPPKAQNAFASSSLKERSEVFFRWWTRVEAAGKAGGRGLDETGSCLDEVMLSSFEGIDGLSLSVAVVGNEPCKIDWHIQT